MITVALENLQVWLMHTDLNKRYPKIELFFWPFETIAIPLFFLFVLNYIGKEQSYKVYRFIMFIPLVFFFLAYAWIKIDLIFFEGTLLAFARKEVNLFRFEEYLAFLFAIFNGFYSYKVIQDFERENSKFSYEKVVAQTVWLKRILYAAFFLCFLWAFTFAFVVFGKFDFGTIPYIPSYLGFSVLVIWLGYIGYYQSRVLYERNSLHSFMMNNTSSSKKNNGNGPISEGEGKSYIHFQNLLDWLANEKAYLNQQLDLRMVSEHLGISPNYVSKILNTHNEKNFSEFINSYRIKEAQKMLLSNDFESYTILSIALEAGFNSRTAFYTSFKKQTGVSPSDYKRLHTIN